MRLKLLLASWAMLNLATVAYSAEVVHFSKIVPLLPEALDGFTGDKPDGTTTSASGFSMTTVSRTYRKGEGDAEQSVRYSINDGAMGDAFKAMRAAMPEFNTESTEGYEKGFKLDGNPAVEKYTTESKEGSLTVLVGDHLVVEVETHGLPKDAMQNWLKKIDLKKLSELKP